jgi:predicted metal-dependent phosphoesterase TrpH
VSDGKFSPAELKEMYKAKGYHAIAYTDHRACIPHNELTDESFVALTGMETAFGIKKNTSVHICGISRDPFKEESLGRGIVFSLLFYTKISFIL